ncbi:hypothetical protein Q7W33_00955, partial [Streptococcus suis]|nr:hypothetical protein [Streptococcus suis]
ARTFLRKSNEYAINTLYHKCTVFVSFNYNMRTLHADLPQYDMDELSPEEKQGQTLNPLVLGLGVALLSSLFAGLADLFSLQLPLLASIFHVKSLLFGGMMGLFASLALSAIAYLQKLEADSVKKK